MIELNNVVLQEFAKRGLSINEGIAVDARLASGTMYFVYAIMSVSRNRVYIGQTREIKQRLQYHNSGWVASTKQDVPSKLIALQEVEDRDRARWIEKGLKQSEGRRKKWLDRCAYGSESEVSE